MENLLCLSTACCLVTAPSVFVGHCDLFWSFMFRSQKCFKFGAFPGQKHMVILCHFGVHHQFTDQMGSGGGV